MRRTAYYWHELSLQHDTGAHVETIGRAEALRPDAVRKLIPDLDARTVVSHDAPAWACRVHDRDYHDWVRTSCKDGLKLLDHGDTVVCERSYDAALASIDAVLTAADAVMLGEADSAFSAMRPPGHHAMPSRAMGFCIFNNIAVLTRYLEEKYRIGRIAIVDWDVHHGNGTQHVFWREPDVFFASMHQFPLWPGTGRAVENGDGPGLGTTLNVPIDPETSEEENLALFKEKVVPAVEDFGPDFLLISAGFDSHRDDPIASLNMTEAGFAEMTRLMVGVADESCKGRIVSCLEGGYNLGALQRSVATHVQALMGR